MGKTSDAILILRHLITDGDKGKEEILDQKLDEISGRLQREPATLTCENCCTLGRKSVIVFEFFFKKLKTVFKKTQSHIEKK